MTFDEYQHPRAGDGKFATKNYSEAASGTEAILGDAGLPMEISAGPHPESPDRDRIAALLRQDGIAGHAVHTGIDEFGRHEYQMTIGRDEQQVVVPWRAVPSARPELDQVVTEMVEDGITYAQSDGYEDWCESLGYDNDDPGDAQANEELYAWAEQSYDAITQLVGDRWSAYAYGDEA